jgi:hypothetical protein
MTRWLGVLAGLVAALAAFPSLAAPPQPALAKRLLGVDRATVWTPAGTIPVQFATFHPQGMVRVGQDFYVSAVEVRRRPTPYAKPQDGHDRDAGAGLGHLFRISADGALLADLILGEGDAYHPGGIDYDGEFIWAPVSEYRPDSRAIIYRVDPATMTPTEVLRAADHIGAVVHDRATGLLHGVSWGGRRFYEWRLTNGRAASKPRVFTNHSSYIDYQDCHQLGGRQMLCSGLASYRFPAQATALALGGWEIVSLEDHRPVWQAPVQLWTSAGRAMTQNPFFAEPTPGGLRAWFMPDDDRSTIFVYDLAVP